MPDAPHKEISDLVVKLYLAPLKCDGLIHD